MLGQMSRIRVSCMRQRHTTRQRKHKHGCATLSQCVVNFSGRAESRRTADATDRIMLTLPRSLFVERRRRRRKFPQHLDAIFIIQNACAFASTAFRPGDEKCTEYSIFFVLWTLSAAAIHAADVFCVECNRRNFSLCHSLCIRNDDVIGHRKMGLGMDAPLWRLLLRGCENREYVCRKLSMRFVGVVDSKYSMLIALANRADDKLI